MNKANKSELKLKDILSVLAIIALLAVSYIRSSIGWHDYDEFAHVNSLRHMSIDFLFSIWQRAGFKLLYLPFYWAGIEILRGINLVLLGIGCYLLIRLKDMNTAIIFMTMPFVMLLGCRFYSEILLMFLLILSFYFYSKNKKLYFSLVVSYMPLVRAEAVLLFIPAIFYLKDKRNILMLFVFPALYYFASIIYYESPTKLINTFTTFAFGERPADDYRYFAKGDYDYYLKVMITAMGIWVFMAFKNWIADYRSFIAQSGLTLLIFYIISYWNIIGTSYSVGNLRHIIVMCPVIAYYALSENAAKQEQILGQKKNKMR